MLRKLAACPILALLVAASASAAPAATKTDEAARFHPPAKGMPSATRLAGHERRIAMEKSTPFANLRFRNVGPEIQGGRIVDLDGPRSRPETLFAAFASGGLWRTDNKGGAGRRSSIAQSSMTLGAFAVGDAEGNVLWAGTGEANSSRTSYAGTGVFKSVDGGKTWTNTGLHDSHHIGKILVDARRPDTVFVASLGPLYTDGGERGLYRTTDGGKSWTKVLGGPGRTGAIDVVQDSKDPSLLFAALWERDRKPWNFLESGPGSGIYRSRDGGATWTRLAGGLPQGDVVGRIGLAVTPARPGTVYAVVDNQARRPGERDEETPPGELTPRRLKALTAEQFAQLETAAVERFLRANDFPKELKARALQKDVASGKVKLSDGRRLRRRRGPADGRGRDRRQGSLALGRRGGDVAEDARRLPREGRLQLRLLLREDLGLARGRRAGSSSQACRSSASDDGGKSWRGLDRLGVHADHHALRFAPGDARHVALGNDGGLNLSWDGGETWTKVNNLPVGQITTIAVDSAEPYNIVCGLQDNGVMRGPSTYVSGKTSREAWKAIFGGDGSWIEIDPKDPNVVYTASQFGHASRLNVKTGERVRFRPRHALGEPALRYNWVTPFLLSPHSRNILWFGTQKLWRSFDRGETWAAVSPDLTSSREPGDVPFGTITTISESPKTFGLLYVGTDEGKVWGTRDGGASWKDLSKGLAKERWVTRVVASAHDEGTVFVSQSGLRNDDFAPYAWKSTDFGATWTSIASGLPNEPVNSVREDPKASHLLWAATDAGAFVSLDRGTTWNALTGGLPLVPVHDLAIHPKDGDVVLGTHGRSAFVAEAAGLRELTPEVAKKALHAFKVKAATWERRRGYGENEFFAWYRVPTTRNLAWWAGAAAAGPATITVRDGKGRVWKEWTASSVAGFNAVDYDLSADASRADANEEAMRKDAAEAAIKAEEKSEKKPEAGAKEKAAEEDDDGDEAGSKATPPRDRRSPRRPAPEDARTLPPAGTLLGRDRGGNGEGDDAARREGAEAGGGGRGGGLIVPECRRRAVVVEDDAETRRFVVRALEEEGLEVRSAGRAESARALLLEPGADVVILDVGLPDATGFELCGEIRRLGLDVPILMLTARSDVASRVEGLEAGADDYLGKPFALAELKARVRALLRRVRSGIAEAVLEHAVCPHRPAPPARLPGRGGDPSDPARAGPSDPAREGSRRRRAARDPPGGPLGTRESGGRGEPRGHRQPAEKEAPEGRGLEPGSQCTRRRVRARRGRQMRFGSLARRTVAATLLTAAFSSLVLAAGAALALRLLWQRHDRLELDRTAGMLERTLGLELKEHGHTFAEAAEEVLEEMLGPSDRAQIRKGTTVLAGHGELPRRDSASGLPSGLDPRPARDAWGLRPGGRPQTRRTVFRSGRLFWAALLLAAIPSTLVALVVGRWAGQAAARPIEDLVVRLGAVHHPRDYVAAAPETLPAEAAVLERAFSGVLGRLGAALDREAEFARNAAHELRTPLTRIRLRTERAAAGATGECRSELEAVTAEVDRLARLADALLVLARDETGGLGAG